MLKKIKRMVAITLMAVLAVSSLTGCGKKVGNTGRNEDGKIVITIGGVHTERTEKNANAYDLFQERKAAFEKANPDIVVKGDSWSFDLRNYLTKAAAGDLPTMFYTSPTELNTLYKSGYIKDITKLAEKYGYADGYDNEKYGDQYMRDGKWYAVFKDGSVSTIGIIYNRQVMEEAGLVNADGSIIFPETWEDLAEMGKTVKEKTGKIGFVFPTSKNQGGWLFLNIAWAYGVNFMEQDASGKWKATFADENGVAALQFIKDLKWKYNALQPESIADVSHQGKYLSSNQAAMTIFGEGITNNWVESYKLDVKDIVMSSNPAGPKGTYSQRNGNVYVFTGTDEQNEACLKWLDFIGEGAEINDAMKESRIKGVEGKYEKGYAIGWGEVSPWIDEERMAAIKEIEAPYVTVDPKDYEHYVNGEGVTYQAEPPMCAQQLYSVIDACLQAVINDKNADCKAIIEKAQKDFQLNYLDKEV